MNWYVKVLKQYLDFSGRARRKEYWFFVLFSIAFTILIIFLDEFLSRNRGYMIGLVYIIYGVFVLLPSLSVSVRRLHDIGKSGLWILLFLIPFAGWFWLLILLCMEGQNKTNKWGENPKGIGNKNAIDQIGTE